MIEAIGVISRCESGRAWVLAEHKTACDSCSAKKNCSQNLISEGLSKSFHQLEVENALDLAAGDQVVLGIPEDALVGTSIVAYLVPLALMIAAAGAATFASMPEGGVVASGMAGLFGGIFTAKWLTRSYMSEHRLHPVMLRRHHVDNHEQPVTII